MSPPHSRPILSSSPPSLSPQKADLYRLYHPSSHPMGFSWTWPIVSTRRMVRGLEEREREGYFFPSPSCLALWFSQGLHRSRTRARPQPPLLHGASALWTSHGCQSLGASRCLIGFLNLAYICVNSSFIKCTSFALSEGNSVFC